MQPKRVLVTKLYEKLSKGTVVEEKQGRSGVKEMSQAKNRQ